MHPGRPLVLIVADDSDSRCELVTNLFEAAYSCITTDNVATALWYVRRLAPQVTLVDVGGHRERAKLAGWLASYPALTTLVLLSPATQQVLPELPALRVSTPCSARTLVEVVSSAHAPVGAKCS